MKKSIFLEEVFLLTLILLGLTGYSVANTVVSIPDVNIEEDQEETIPIMIEDVVEVKGSYMQVQYDPLVVNVLELGVGDLNFPTYEVIDNDSGIIHYAAITLVEGGLSGDIKLTDVTLKAVGNPGDSSIMEITVVSLLGGSQSEQIPHTVNNGIFTILIPDNIAPTIDSHTPTGTDVDVGTTITVPFSEEMKSLETEQALVIEPNVTGSFSWNEYTMIFEPEENLEYSTLYSITISAEAEDLAGNNLTSDYRWSFTTESKSEPPGCALYAKASTHPLSSRAIVFGIISNLLLMLLLFSMILLHRAMRIRKEKLICLSLFHHGKK